MSEVSLCCGDGERSISFADEEYGSGLDCGPRDVLNSFFPASTGIVGCLSKAPGFFSLSLRRALSCFFCTISRMRESMRSLQ